MYKFKMKRYDFDSVKSLGFCYAFTNSELTSFSCHRKYSYEYIENIETDSFSKPMFFGTCWHYLCENVLYEISLEDKMIDYDKLNEIYSTIVIPFINKELDSYSLEETLRQEIYESIVSNISLGMYGWLDKWASDIHPNFRVIDVEKELIKPIYFKSNQYKEKLKLIKDKHEEANILRFPLIGELNSKNANVQRSIICGEYDSKDSLYSEVEEFDVPVYKIGKLDCILIERDSGSLWVLDHKTSATPSVYAKKMMFDLQLYSYCSLLRYAIDQGAFKQYGNVFVGGIIWDIASSKYNKPTYDSQGFLKIVKRGYITKSIALSILSDEKYNDIRNTYSDYIDTLSERDEKTYIIIKEMISDSDLDRVDNEDFVNAKAVIQARSNCYSVDLSDKDEMDAVLKRFPICMTYNFCTFFDSCSRNASVSDPNLIDCSRIAKQYWISK